ncbi:hypothetical protein LWM68_24710 [Niabella sp. W65]|nr:hypothetical protein [Niabella sp. W65]MCH7365692.1 hypothetical protein [Niabella sp. W65]ULT41459.1 hypothetical protein KRR40_43620 [Niabella sp. I65]
MLKKFIIVSLFVTIYSGLQAQDNVYPAGPQKGTLVIKNGTVYTATGNVIHNGAVVIKDGKITEVGTTVSEEAGATIIDAKGKNVYPGLILPNTDLGLSEIGSGVRGVTIILNWVNITLRYVLL